MDLGNAAQRVCILYAAAGDVRLADLAALQQLPQSCRTLALAGVRAGGVNARVERYRRSTERVANVRAAANSRQPIASIACVPLIRLKPSLG